MTNPANPTPEEVTAMQAEIAAKVAEEQKALGVTGPAPIEITSEFVMECLDAEQLGNGILYAALHKDKLVFAKGSEAWYVWDEHSFIRDEMDTAISAVENVALRFAEEIKVQGAALAEVMKAATDNDDDGPAKRIRGRIGRLHARVKQLRKDPGRTTTLKFAHTNPVNPLAVRAADFDLDPWKLACANGVINLRTGELEPGKPSDYISKRARAAFPPEGVNADTSAFTDILLTIHNGDAAMVEYKQRYLGYGITGNSTEHIFPVWFGRGRNGKGLEIESLSYTLGDYAGPVPSEMLLDSNRSASAGATTPEIMALKGLRLAFASETDEGRRFSSAKVKWLTGGDTLTGRGLYDKHMITFTPTHLLILLTNHKPNAPDSDFAFWERAKLIAYKLSFVDRSPEELAANPLKPHERTADKNLPEKLRDMSDLILAWLVKGCLQWQKIGMVPPESVREATLAYQSDENYLGQFLEAACTQAAESRAGSSELYEAFCHWYKANVNDKDRFLPSQKAFGAKLVAADLFERKRSGGCYFYIGLSVSEDYQAKMADSAGDDR